MVLQLRPWRLQLPLCASVFYPQPSALATPASLLLLSLQHKCPLPRPGRAFVFAISSAPPTPTLLPTALCTMSSLYPYTTAATQGCFSPFWVYFSPEHLSFTASSHQMLLLSWCLCWPDWTMTVTGEELHSIQLFPAQTRLCS